MAAPDLSRARCESPGFVRFMTMRLPRLTSVANGKTQFSQNFAVDSVTHSATVSARPNELVCEVTMRLGARGSDHSVSGRFTIQQFPNGRQHLRWQPGY